MQLHWRNYDNACYSSLLLYFPYDRVNHFTLAPSSQFRALHSPAAIYLLFFFLSAVGSSGGGSGTKPSSTSSAVAAIQAQKVGTGRSSTSRTADAAAAAAAPGASRGTAADGVKKAASRQAKRATAERKKGATLAGGGDGSDSYVYTESLAYLSSPPEKALKGVGPRRAEQLAKLGRYHFRGVQDVLVGWFEAVGGCIVVISRGYIFPAVPVLLWGLCWFAGFRSMHCAVVRAHPQTTPPVRLSA